MLSCFQHQSKCKPLGTIAKAFKGPVQSFSSWRFYGLVCRVTHSTKISQPFFSFQRRPWRRCDAERRRFELPPGMRHSAADWRPCYTECSRSRYQHYGCQIVKHLLHPTSLLMSKLQNKYGHTTITRAGHAYQRAATRYQLPILARGRTSC